MQTFIKTSYINCEVTDLFDFHMQPSNILKITPKDTKVEMISNSSHPKLNEIVKIKTTKYFISMMWEVKITQIEKPNLLVDLALKSPFAFWEHKHIFIKHKDRSELRDVITYKLPFGFIGKLFGFFIKKDIQKMFDYRHKITKEILENRK